MSPRAQLLRAAAQLVGSAATDGGELTVLITVNGARLQLRASPAEMAELAAPSLTPMEEAILEALLAGPAHAEPLAERAGYPCHSRFRSSLARLVKLGLITEPNGDGYRLSRDGTT